MAIDRYTFTDLSTTRSEITSGKLSAEELTSFYLSKIKEEDKFNAFLEVFETSAMNYARLVDQKKKNGQELGKLAGAIIGIKDNLCYTGHTVTAASRILEDFESMFTATAVQRLIEEDAIIIGRLNCDEFAMGSSNENSSLGPVKNPINPELVPGGSSGGSAAAVAGDLCMASLGSDTGGSIRQPAAFTGLVGLKPTYGRISRYGLIAFASSFDQIGPFTKSVKDSELMYQVMAGDDPMDSTSSKRPVHKKPHQKKTYRFAYYKEVINSSGLHAKTKELFQHKIDALKSAGHEVVEVSFPYLDHLVPCYYVLTTAEASSNLSRYDGVHFGRRSEKAADIPSTYFNSRTEGLGEEVKRRIMMGTFVLSTGYYDAYYNKGQQVRRMIKTATDELLADVDFLISPTTPHPAFKLGEKADDPIALYLEDIFTVQANLSGNPAITVPMGMTDDGLPLGFQLFGKSFGEETLFHAATLVD